GTCAGGSAGRCARGAPPASSSPRRSVPRTSIARWASACGDRAGDRRGALRVERLAGLEHLDEPGQPPRARLGAAGVVEPVEDRVAVLAAELGEERGGARPGV